MVGEVELVGEACCAVGAILFKSEEFLAVSGLACLLLEGSHIPDL